jgi:hypothetical protein
MVGRDKPDQAVVLDLQPFIGGKFLKAGADWHAAR